VNGKDYCCPKTAAVAAKANGAPCEYKVGECKTKCETTARVELAKSRIEAAEKVLGDTGV
jgi:hypothetical protein